MDTNGKIIASFLGGKEAQQLRELDLQQSSAFRKGKFHTIELLDYHSNLGYAYAHGVGVC